MMADEPDKSGENQDRDKKGRWRPGASGNLAGKPRGLRSKAVRAAEELLDGEADALTRKAIEMAKGGDLTAMRLCLDRIIPPRKERPLHADLPPITDASDLPGWTTALMDKVASGEVMPGEAEALAKIAEGHRRATELIELEQRIANLEKQFGGTTK